MEDKGASAKDVSEIRFKKAIVVEENPVTRSMLVSMLRQYKLEIVDVGTADEALAALNEFAADIVFTEYMMTNMTGDELAQKIHCSPKSFNVKVIAVTADVACAEKSGDVFDGIVHKPVTSEKLGVAMRRIL